MTWLLVAACGVASIPAAIRWLRIAQREHYHAPEVTRFSVRWWVSSPANLGLTVLAIIGAVGSIFDPRWGFLVAAAQVGPLGLTLKGVTSPLAWTARLRRLAVVTGIIVLVVYVIGGLTSQPLIVVLPLLALPAVIDFSMWALAPIEKRMGDQWVEKATAKLQAIAPDVVAITGSYGKTTTKNYVAHLLGGSKRVVASPASFNNRMGLARAINENLVVGTEVFIAEMGTYGPGEIRELCQWIPPKVAALVSVGPVHLERFKSIERIVAAKSEILDRAEVGVICIDHPHLAGLAADRSKTMEIIAVSSEDVVAPEGVFAGNLAVAVGICEALGLPRDEVMGRVGSIPSGEHRQSVSRGQAGFAIVDDTFNSNPVGALSALATLRGLASGKLAVITPGMVELGPRQSAENQAFAKAASAAVDHLVIVGKTNRKALLSGSGDGRASVTVVDSRAEAVEWARENLGPGDGVLYENDLPDHYP